VRIELEMAGAMKAMRRGCAALRFCPLQKGYLKAMKAKAMKAKKVSTAKVMTNDHGRSHG